MVLKKEFFHYGLFLGDKGLSQGFKDFGNYFKCEKTKEIWENKIPVKSTKNSNFSGKGAGKKFMSIAFDLIEVDTKKGILYCIQDFEKLKIVSGKFY